ncbi:MAG: MarR family winged helix-turn-helix transcriptional regulator [Proteobacteria bacterium]|nr:MarR family winged helix-turn-helix transcriptional regulator [Pseudomonadota bacterium]
MKAARAAAAAANANDANEATDTTAFVEDYLPALLGQASHLVSSAFHRVVLAHGLSVAEWRVLASLADNGTMSTGRLAQLSLTKGPTATRLLDRMQARGQVQRLAHDGDRRVTLVRITPQGRRTVARLMTLAKQHEQAVLQPFGPDAARQLKQTLRRLIDSQSEPERPAAAGRTTN